MRFVDTPESVSSSGGQPCRSLSCATAQFLDTYVPSEEEVQAFQVSIRNDRIVGNLDINFDCGYDDASNERRVSRVLGATTPVDL